MKYTYNLATLEGAEMPQKYTDENPSEGLPKAGRRIPEGHRQILEAVWASSLSGGMLVGRPREGRNEEAQGVLRIAGLYTRVPSQGRSRKSLSMRLYHLDRTQRRYSWHIGQLVFCAWLMGLFTLRVLWPCFIDSLLTQPLPHNHAYFFNLLSSVTSSHSHPISCMDT